MATNHICLISDIHIEFNTVFALRKERLPLGHLGLKPISAFMGEPLTGQLMGLASIVLLLVPNSHLALFKQHIQKGTDADKQVLSFGLYEPLVYTNIAGGEP